MTDLQAALTEALEAFPEPTLLTADRLAAAILAHPAMSDLARKAAALDALIDAHQPTDAPDDEEAWWCPACRRPWEDCVVRPAALAAHDARRQG